METNSVNVKLVEGPLDANLSGAEWLAEYDGYGAKVVFEGIVRPTEGGSPIKGLRYEAYEPMTSQELHRLATQILEKHSVLAILVEHSVGLVKAGEASFRLTVASAHRKEAIAAADEFIDEMKRQVPIWKNLV